jgi:hypothetical protein
MYAVMYCCSGTRNYRTFKKHIAGGATEEPSDRQFDTMSYSVATLGSQDLRLAVMLPDGEDLNEWVAVHSKYQRNYLQMF